jgi:L-iditol 2-dehydrogenase
MAIPTTMTATVLVAPHRFELLERPVPTPGDEDVLVQVRACGICGTDLKIIHHAALRRVHLWA